MKPFNRTLKYEIETAVDYRKYSVKVTVNIHRFIKEDTGIVE